MFTVPGSDLYYLNLQNSSTITPPIYHHSIPGFRDDIHNTNETCFSPTPHNFMNAPSKPYMICEDGLTIEGYTRLALSASFPNLPETAEDRDTALTASGRFVVYSDYIRQSAPLLKVISPEEVIWVGRIRIPYAPYAER